ncbi:MAG TPA: T9SS type A sorting domain-containing protein [Bacteroidales bacterium]|nr:T9SS type A sorting domain-containing protein [Bacteroidales bacterium]
MMRAGRVSYFTTCLFLTLRLITEGQGLPPDWEYRITPSFHPVAISLDANPSLFGYPLSPGDYIGVFFMRNDSLICGGASGWAGTENIAVVAFGDDNMTPLKDGFSVNEPIHWKIYSWLFEEEFIASVTYDPSMPNHDGTFHPGGLSALTGLWHGSLLQAAASAVPDTLCTGTTAQLTSLATGGSDSYGFLWTSVPEGFSSGAQNPVVIPLQTTAYVVHVNDGYHTATDTALVVVVQLPGVQAGGDTAICENGQVNLHGIPTNYQRIGWFTDGDGVFTDSLQATTSYFPGSSDKDDGLVKLTLKAWADPPCVDSASDYLYVTIGPLPVVDAGDDGDACAGDSYPLIGYAVHAASVEWSTSGDGSFDNPNYLGATYYPGQDDQESGEVNLILSAYPVAPCQMTMNDPMTVFLHPLPFVDAGVDHWISYGTSTQLNSTVTGGSGEYEYLWAPAEYLVDPEEEDPMTVNLYQSTAFVLTGTDAVYTCVTQDTAIVYITGGPLSVSASASPGVICTGSASHLHALPGGGSGNYSFVWTSEPPGFYSEEPDPWVYPEVTRLYIVTVNDGFNYSSDTVTVQVLSHPKAQAGEDQTIPYGTSTLLDGTFTGGSGEFSWNWSPAQYLVDPQSEDPATVNLTRSVEFVLTVTDLMTLCQGSDTVNVNVVGGPLQVSVTSTPKDVCAGGSSQLNALAAGGSGDYTYAWTSDPPGFFSDQDDPLVTPGMTTDYFVQVFDGYTTASDYTTIEVFPVPVVDIEAFPGDTVCAGEVIRLDASTPGGVEYYWLPGGHTGPVIEVDSAGIGFGSAMYTVYVTTPDGCTGVDSVGVTFVDCVGIKENASQDMQLHVYPNPARGEMWIRIEKDQFATCNGTLGTYQIEIMDITGRVRLNSSWPVNESIYSISFDSFPGGIYIVLVKKDSLILWTEKVVVY